MQSQLGVKSTQSQKGHRRIRGRARGAPPPYFCRLRYFSLKKVFSANYIKPWILDPRCQENAYLAVWFSFFFPRLRRSHGDGGTPDQFWKLSNIQAETVYQTISERVPSNHSCPVICDSNINFLLLIERWHHDGIYGVHHFSKEITC